MEGNYMPYVDVQFKLSGKEIPVDHGYLLLSAISRIVPFVHDNDEIGIHPIPGQLAGDRKLILTPGSHLTMRLPSEGIVHILPLAGKTLELNGSKLTIGIPNSRQLIPAARLYSRLVVIKGFLEPEPFLEAVKRQLQEMGIKGTPLLVNQAQVEDANKGKTTGSHSPVLRRTLKIRDKEIVGFAMRVQDLTAEESILLQEKGLGGRRKFGCGVFVGDIKEK
jgi:CRISPR-associated protein Cas6